MKSPLRYFICCVFLLSYVSISAQVEFAISVNGKKIGKRDKLQVNYELVGASGAPRFTPPAFGTDWEIVAGPMNGYEAQQYKGRKSSLFTYTYVLTPKATGRLKLPSTTIIVDGKTVRCKEVFITVLTTNYVDDLMPAQPQLQVSISKSNDQAYETEMLRPGEDAVEKMKKNLFIRVEASKKQCYVGEPVLVTYKLYTRLESQSVVAKQPGFTGCSVEEMTTDQDQKAVEVVNGKRFTRYVIRKVQLFPLQPGRITVGAATVDNTVTFVKNANEFRDIYYGKKPEQYGMTVRSEPFSIEVLPLPEKGNTSTIGDFTISTRLKQSTVAANTTNTLIVTIAGRGNFRSITEPEVRWPADVYHFDAVEKDSLDQLSFPLEGKKVYEIPFEPTRSGELVFEPVLLSYFDPVQKKYRTVKSATLQLTVTPAIKARLQQSVLNNEDSFDIKYLLYGLPVLFFLGTLIILHKTRRKKIQLSPQQSTETDVPLAPTFNAVESLDELVVCQNDAEFYNKARTLAQQMMENNMGQKDVLLKVVRDCNTVLYTPIPSTSRKEIVDALQKVIQ